MSEAILAVDDLHVDIASPRGIVHAVRGVSLELAGGEFLGIVGESGCGKSTLLRAILGLLPASARIVGGAVRYRGRAYAEPGSSRVQELRGNAIGMIFQEPLTALNPIMKVGDQIAEAPRWELGYSHRDARQQALELMRQVGIPDPVRRYDAYPHQLSGGLRQRILIAMALSAEPNVLLCDEPTTALDVTIQDQILKLLRRLAAERGLGVIYVTHDLGVVAQLCQRVAVMYAGQLLEQGDVRTLFAAPQHPYTAGLLAAVPDVTRLRTILTPIPGAPPDLAAPPDGCPFHPRCPYQQADCLTGQFPLRALNPDRATACIHPDRIEGRIYEAAQFARHS